MKLKKPITQKHKLGCGIACLAFITNRKYEEVLKYFGTDKANKKGLYCKEIVDYLRKNGFYAEFRYLNNKWRRKIYRDYTIVFIRRSKKYPYGHYLVRYKNFWMDPWINIQKNKNILSAKSGFRRRLPDRPIYGVFIIKPMNYVIVFDLDGTIINSVELHAKSFMYAIKKLGYKNYKELYRKYKKFIGIPLEEIIKLIMPNMTKEEIKKIKKLKDYYFQKNLKKIKIFKKLLKIIKKLKENKFKLTIFTSSPRKITNLVLRKLNLKKYFDYVVCQEDVSKPKPDKEGLIKIMKKFKTKNLIFIGDSEFDKLAAENAKVKFINAKKVNEKNLYKILVMN